MESKDAVMPEPIVFGKYQLLEKIGWGGMAEIYKARSTGPGGFEKVVVIKKVLPSYAENRAFVKMLIAEANVCASLQHPNIVQIYELGEVEDQPYIALEYVHGKDLLKLLRRCTKLEKKMPTELALFVTSEICKGLEYAHMAKDVRGNPLNIIHRDVSPSNIILSYEGEPKIMDFGVARASRERGPTTRSGVLKGKMGYMSPEQVTGEVFDHRADIFSLGIILYESLTLKRLFLGKSDLKTLINIRDVRIDGKLERHDYIPEGVKEILRKALEKNPDERYRSAQDFYDGIQDYLFEQRIRVDASHLRKFLREIIDEAGEAVVSGIIPLGNQGSPQSASELDGEDLGVDEEAHAPRPIQEVPDSEEEKTVKGGGTPARVPAPAAVPVEPASSSENEEARVMDARGSEPEVQAPAIAIPPPPEEEARVMGAGGSEPEVQAPAIEASQPVIAPENPTETLSPPEKEAEVSPRSSSPLPISMRDTAVTDVYQGASDKDVASAPVDAPPDDIAGETSKDDDENIESLDVTVNSSDWITVLSDSGENSSPEIKALESSVFRLKDRHGHVFGPIAFTGFVNMLRSHCIEENAAVSVDGQEWTPVSELTGLQEIWAGNFGSGRQALREGKLSLLGLSKLVYELAANRETGVIRIKRKADSKEIFFKGGRPRHITSNVKEELFGKFLVDRDVLSMQDLDRALVRAKQTNSRLGDTLIALELLRPDELYRFLNRQFHERFVEVFSWRDGSYTFFEGEHPTSDVVPLELEALEVITEGVRHHYGLELLKPLFSATSDTPYLLAQGGAITVQNLRFNVRESRFYSYMESADTLRDVLRKQGRSAEDCLTIYRVAFLLQEVGLLRFIES